MASDDTEEEPTVEIVYAHARTDPDDPDSVEPRTKTVPADWYETHQHARDVLRQVKDEWIRKEGVRAIGLVADDEPSISVTVTPASRLHPVFPESVEGVPVNVRESDPDRGQML